MSTRPISPPLPLLILALDGATFDVIRPMAAAGRLPNLSRWMAEGRNQTLPSTTPPMTFPAWSSFMTGLDPGEHGIFDFTQKVGGAYRIRFSNASDRTGESLFGRVCAAGGRVLVLGMPATFPPEPLDGLLVPGFDAPVSAGSDADSTSNPELYRAIAERTGPWMRPDLKEGARGADFHDRAVEVLLDRIDRKTAFALEAVRALRDQAGGERPELVAIVFSESDTVGHHYFRDHDAGSPRHDPTASRERRGAIEAVYERLDAACGRIRSTYGDDAPCLVVSDHGMGAASRWIVHLNRHLADCGLLVRKRGGALTMEGIAKATRKLAVEGLPPRLAQALFRRARASAARLESAARFGGFDWTRTLAFSEEANTQPGVWINLAGREARGCVAPGEYEKVRGAVIDALQAWHLPDGEAVVASARRREDVYSGPFVERAPDIVVELGSERGYGLSLVATPWGRDAGRPALRRLEDEELGGGRGRGMNGTHRQDGVFICSGASDRALPASLVDVPDFALAEMGIDTPGRPRADGTGPDPRREYSDEEDAMVARRLRALGYLE